MLTDERLAFYKSAPYIDPWDAYQDMKLMQAEIDRLKAERIIDADWEKMIAARDEVIERLEASLEIDGVTLAEQHKQITTLKAENDRLKKILSELAYYEEHPEKFETISEENNRLTTKADAEGAEVVELKAELEEADVLIAKLQCEALADTDALKDELGEMEEVLEELKATFSMRWRADRRAIKQWHDSGGDELTLPDHADLCVWLLSQLAEAQWIIEKARYPHDANHFRPTPEESRWNKKRANWLGSHPEQDKEQDA